MNKIIRLLSACFGVGYLPFAPGTIATLLGVIVYWFGVRQFIENREPFNLLIYLVVIILLFVIGVVVSRVVMIIFTEKDSHSIVIDEVVGFLVAMFGLPPRLIYVIAAFILFRILDITKPSPIRYIHTKIKGGLGIMLDDILSGIITCIILHIVVFSS